MTTCQVFSSMASVARRRQDEQILGNIRDPNTFADTFGVEALRYYLMRDWLSVRTWTSRTTLDSALQQRPRKRPWQPAQSHFEHGASISGRAGLRMPILRDDRLGYAAGWPAPFDDLRLGIIRKGGGRTIAAPWSAIRFTLDCTRLFRLCSTAILQSKFGLRGNWRKILKKPKRSMPCFTVWLSRCALSPSSFLQCFRARPENFRTIEFQQRAYGWRIRNGVAFQMVICSINPRRFFPRIETDWGTVALVIDPRRGPTSASFIGSVSDFTPTLRQRLEFLGLSSFVWLVGRFPYRWLRHIANVLGSIVFLFDKRGKEVAVANLDAAFGNSRTPAEKRQIAVGSYRTFARTMLELFWSPNLSESVARGIARYEGLELDSCHKDARQAAVYLCLHYSNFEWFEPVRRLHDRQWSGHHAAIQKSSHWPHFRPYALEHWTRCDSTGTRDDSDA